MEEQPTVTLHQSVVDTLADECRQLTGERDELRRKLAEIEDVVLMAYTVGSRINPTAIDEILKRKTVVLKKFEHDGMHYRIVDSSPYPYLMLEVFENEAWTCIGDEDVGTPTDVFPIWSQQLKELEI